MIFKSLTHMQLFEANLESVWRWAKEGQLDKAELCLTQAEIILSTKGAFNV